MRLIRYLMFGIFLGSAATSCSDRFIAYPPPYEEGYDGDNGGNGFDDEFGGDEDEGDEDEGDEEGGDGDRR